MNLERNKITLFLMTFKGYSVLDELIAHEKSCMIHKVVIGEDKNVDKDYSSEIKELCRTNNITFENNCGSNKIQTQYAIAVSWKWIIDIRDYKLIVIHDSLLPKYRGFAPLVNLLKNGEKETGVTAVFAEISYDKGEIIHQLKTDIIYPKKINDLIKEISVLYNQMILYLFDLIEKNCAIPSVKQNENEATYSLWLDEDDYFIDWNKPSEDVIRFIDAVGAPYKGASAYLKTKKVRIISAELIPDLKIENRCPGKVIFKEEGCPVVVCGKGLLRITGLTDENQESILPVKGLRLRFRNSRKDQE
ncbi:MAG: methionyl-tRNA formyltransferase [Candidatus Delongbacteria bacterium]|nr:methionyl-tRNA formyltransferase [Candidatus Delongbacteria bacterium]